MTRSKIIIKVNDSRWMTMNNHPRNIRKRRIKWPHELGELAKRISEAEVIDLGHKNNSIIVHIKTKHFFTVKYILFSDLMDPLLREFPCSPADCESEENQILLQEYVNDLVEDQRERIRLFPLKS